MTLQVRSNNMEQQLITANSHRLTQQMLLFRTNHEASSDNQPFFHRPWHSWHSAESQKPLRAEVTIMSQIKPLYQA